MAQIISLHSFRGGTGKSNTTANLATLLAGEGRRVGVIDTDIQSPGIHVLFGLRGPQITHALNDYLWGRCSVADIARPVLQDVLPDRLFLIPSSIKADDIVQVIRQGYDVRRLTMAFRELIDHLHLDVLLIDTHLSRWRRAPARSTIAASPSDRGRSFPCPWRRTPARG